MTPNCETYTVVLPAKMDQVDDEAALDFWRERCHAEGYAPAGPAQVTREDPFVVLGDDGKLSRLFEDQESVVHVEGPVVFEACLEPLPVAEPDDECVEAMAHRLAQRHHPSAVWDLMPDAVRRNFTMLAYDLLASVMPYVTPAVLEHIVANPEGFMLTEDESDVVSELAHLTRAEVSPDGHW